jgi:hypothetical protein
MMMTTGANVSAGYCRRGRLALDPTGGVWNASSPSRAVAQNGGSSPRQSMTSGSVWSMARGWPGGIWGWRSARKRRTWHAAGWSESRSRSSPCRIATKP